MKKAQKGTKQAFAKNLFRTPQETVANSVFFISRSVDHLASQFILR